MSQTMEELLTLKEAMRYLRVSRSKLLRMMKEGEIPAYKVGHDWRFYQSELKQVIKPVSAKK